MKLSYTGAMSDLSGRVCTVSGLTRDNLLHGGYNGAPLAVQDIFNLSADATRMSPNGFEIKARPGPNSEIFRTAGGTLIEVPAPGENPWYSSDNKDNCFDVIEADGTYHQTKEPLTGARPGTGICFAWQGIATDQPLTFEIYKVLEWRPKASAGIVQAPAQTLGYNVPEAAESLLDRIDRNWPTIMRAANVAQRTAGVISQIALTGSAGIGPAMLHLAN
jgi:hypothetical protein